MKPDISLAGFINSLKSIFKLRNIILILSVVISFIVYFAISEYYAPFRNVLNYINQKNDRIHFYSGSPKGFYNIIGSQIQEQKGKHDFNDGITIDAVSNTAGGLENAIQVISRSNSIGLIQESTLSVNDPLREQIDYIAPLYMERLHILIKTENLNKTVDSKRTSPYELGVDSDLDRKIFADKNISIGPVGSGSRIVGSYLLEILEAKPKNILGIEQKNGIEYLKDGKIDIYMVIVGSPMKDIHDLLEEGNYELIGISPALINRMNEKYNTNYRFSSFKSKYSKSNDINTIGSYAYLISAKGVDSRMKLKVLRRISDRSDQIKASLDFESDFFVPDSVKFQLDEVDFIAGVPEKEIDAKMTLWKSIILFIASIITSILVSTWILVWVFSSLKLARYFRLVNKIYSTNFPAEFKIDKEARNLYMGDLPQSNSEKLRTLVKGISNMFELISEVREDYETGGISESHYRHLISNLKDGLRDFRKAIARNLFYTIQNPEERIMIDYDLVLNYYTSSFIESDNFNMLVAELEKKKPRKSK